MFIDAKCIQLHTQQQQQQQDNNDNNDSTNLQLTGFSLSSQEIYSKRYLH